MKTQCTFCDDPGEVNITEGFLLCFKHFKDFEKSLDEEKKKQKTKYS